MQTYVFGKAAEVQPRSEKASGRNESARGGYTKNGAIREKQSNIGGKLGERGTQHTESSEKRDKTNGKA